MEKHETEELIKIFIMSIKTAEKNKNSHSRFDIGFLKTNEIKLRSGATSLFDVQRWTFDVQPVRRSSFKTIQYGINATRLQNNLAFTGFGDQAHLPTQSHPLAAFLVEIPSEICI